MEHALVPEQFKPPLDAARKARLNAYAPNSGCRVGAALLTEDGTIFIGANVEPRTQSLTCCAERVAIMSAVTQGHLSFKSIAIVSDKGHTPCGSCLQLIYELCGQIDVVVATAEGVGSVMRTSDLLPHPFQAINCHHHDRN